MPGGANVVHSRAQDGRCRVHRSDHGLLAMKFSGDIRVPAPQDPVFTKLNDARFFASCVEGVGELNELDPTHYPAPLETRLAYIKFSFAVEVEITKIDAPNEIVAKAEGRPLGVVGRLTATSSALLRQE